MMLFLSQAPRNDLAKGKT